MIRKQLPNFLTLLNLFIGFLAILNTYIENYTLACYFILLASILDSLDGKIARLFGVSTEFGKELDSLSDLISFCLAPSLLIYILYSQNMPGISGELIAFSPLMLGVIRLARFNVNENENSSFFKGLPTTFNAIFICSLILYIENIKTIYPEYSQPALLLPIIITSSFLMVSKIEYPKFPALNFRSGRLNTIKVYILIFTLVSFLLAVLLNQKESVLMLFSSMLIVFGFLYHLFIKEKIHINFIKKIIN